MLQSRRLRRARVPALAVMGAAALSFGSSPAFGNGRYPNADMLIVDPSDPTHLVLRATFGTLVSNDQGSRWSWICEESVGYTGDAAMTVLAGGTLLHAFLGNVMISSENGCSFSRLPFEAQGRNAVDVTLDPADPSHAWVLGSGLLGRRQANLLLVTASTATPLAVVDDFVPGTIDVARARPERMYIVGFDGSFQSTLLSSDDRGQSWSARPIQPYGALPMYLSAIDPLDPDTVYVRVDDGTSDHLIVSRDAGQSFTDVFTLGGDMLGFALSPDGSRVAVGGPDAGLWVANSADLAFAMAAPIQSLRGLTWADGGLYASAQESLDGWTLARSTDFGQSFAPLWHVQDLEPLACAASTSVGAVCSRAWLDVSAQIGAELVPGGSPYSGGMAAGRVQDDGCALAPARVRGAGSAARAPLALAAAALLAAARRRLERRAAS